MLRRLVQAVQLLTLGVVGACLVLLVIAQPEPAAPPVAMPPGVTIDPVVFGATVYEAQCESCHGKWGEGVYAPVTIDGAASLRAFPDPSGQVEVVRSGRGQMPAFGGRLTDEQIAAVVAYLRQLS